jgi:hypothetical protein
MLATRGLGPSCLLATAGLGPYQAFIVIPPDEEEPDTGGGRFQVAPRRIYIRSKVGEPTLRLADIKPDEVEEILGKATEVVVEGEPYLVAAGRVPAGKKALEELPPTVLAEKIKAVREELGVTKKQAVKALEQRATKELRAAREFKLSLVREDDELALIIILAEATDD